MNKGAHMGMHRYYKFKLHQHVYILHVCALCKHISIAVIHTYPMINIISIFSCGIVGCDMNCRFSSHTGKNEKNIHSPKIGRPFFTILPISNIIDGRKQYLHGAIMKMCYISSTPIFISSKSNCISAATTTYLPCINVFRNCTPLFRIMDALKDHGAMAVSIYSHLECI